MKKIAHIFKLLEMLYHGRELYLQDTSLLDELGVDERTLRRYLADIADLYSNVIIVEKAKKEIDGRQVSVYRTANKAKENYFMV